MLDERRLMFLAGIALRLSIYLAGAGVGLAVACMMGCSIRYCLHIGAPHWDAKAFFIALTFAMLADEIGKRLLFGRGGT